MPRGLKMTDIEESSGNVYADLGRGDAREMLIKAQLATKIGAIIKARHLTQVEAARILAMPQPKVSEMLRGKIQRYQRVQDDRLPLSPWA